MGGVCQDRPGTIAAGMISKLDADQFEAERANAAAKAAEFEGQKVQKENQFSVLAGSQPRPDFSGALL